MGRVRRGETDMKKKALVLSLMTLLIANAGATIACEYKAGETKFADYANCRYGEDSIQIVKLPEGSTWDSCVYYLEAFRPPKLLAVTQVAIFRPVSPRSQARSPASMPMLTS